MEERAAHHPRGLRQQHIGYIPILRGRREAGDREGGIFKTTHNTARSPTLHHIPAHLVGEPDGSMYPVLRRDAVAVPPKHHPQDRA